MAYTPDTPLVGEERARVYSAIAVAAWRDHTARSGVATPTTRAAPRGRPETPPEGRAQVPRRFASVHRQEASSGSDTPSSRPLSSSVRFQPSESVDAGDTEERLSVPDTDGSAEPETTPLLLECEYGRLLVMPVLISSLINPTESGRTRRLQRASLQRHDRSRRTSHTGSSDAALSRPSPAILRLMGGVTDEGTTDAGFSTEEEAPSGAETDKDSVRSGSRRGENGTVMLLTLHTRDGVPSDGQQTWRTLQHQALCFAEANAPDGRPLAELLQRTVPIS
ncbi:hypothetical protein MBRA1_002647 [Malassezia brasiliensis]|uniref:Uncharacterized protein n=1 Tax=Malassezia brasiliensis TaxID=1821822 RepID=A0AAF0DUI0_9BASI|nr:hypothetical protein MBRA1_002647 [Malassezia brasiliensis]